MLILAIFLGVIVWQLWRIQYLIDLLRSQIIKLDSDSIHDTTHPAFSIQQLRQARQRFEIEYRNKLLLEAQLYSSNEWHEEMGKPEKSFTKLLERMRSVCEAIVESECSWKEYVWMVEANLSVATGRETRRAVLDGFRKLQQQTRGGTVLNSNNVIRVNKILASWTTRVEDSDNGVMFYNFPDFATETFDFHSQERLMRDAFASSR